MTLDELTQGFLFHLEAANVEDKKNVVEVWKKRFEEAGYGPLEWNGKGWSMNHGNRTVIERTGDSE